MKSVTYLGIKFVTTFVIGLLTLALFDSNSVIWVMVYAILTILFNHLILNRLTATISFGDAGSFVEGISATTIAWLMALIFAGFRGTFLTLVALGIAITLSSYFFENIFGIEI